MPTEPRTDYRVGIRDETRRGVASVKRNVGELNKTLLSIGAGLSTLGISAFLVQTSRSLQRTEDLARRLGETTQGIRGLAFAFEQSSISMENFGTIAQRIQRRAGEAASGNRALAETFRRLNIDARSFAALPLTEQLITLERQLAKIPNEAQRMAAAVKIGDVEFGRFLQTVNETGTGISGAIEDFEELGGRAGVVESAAKNMDEFADSMHELYTGARTFAIWAFSDQGLGSAFEWVGRNAAEAGRVLAAFGRLVNQGQLISQQRLIVELDQQLRLLRQRRDDINRQNPLSVYNEQAGRGDSRRLQAVNEQIQTTIDNLARARIDMQVMRSEFEASFQSQDVSGAGVGALSSELDNLFGTAGDARTQLDRFANSVRRRFTPAIQVAADEQAKLEQLLEQGAITQDQYANAIFASIDSYQEFSGSLETTKQQLIDQIRFTRDLRNSFSDFFDSAIDGAKSLNDAFDDLAEQIARLVFQREVVKPLADAAGGFLDGIIGNLFSNQHGGVYKIAGSGTGERPFMMTGKPGEIVTVTPNGGAMGGSAGLHVTFEITSLDPKQAAQVIVENRDVIVGVVRQSFAQAGSNVRMV